ncbi:helix-turn-helix transcriptional regulator [Nocardioides bigeumensis]|uniref:Helix-turn-helix domain-containing protein n=1 Tax=Nocardioides bigeumensis TaxID=433657 RepID=A0ABP5JZG0_9ACTN
MDDLHSDVTSIGALAEPTRLALYRYVAGAPGPISREQAAAAVDLPLHTVKFHLDRLVDEGLLEVEHRRLTGRTGPGAGRPSKLYRRASREVAVSLPERRYDLAAEVLAAAVDQSARDGSPIVSTLARVAHETGSQITNAQTSRPRGGRRAETARLVETLAAHGYEPRLVDDDVCLTNCPFDRLAAGHTELVCGMNLALVDGVLDGLDVTSMTARLEPQPGFCCVKVATTLR